MSAVTIDPGQPPAAWLNQQRQAEAILQGDFDSSETAIPPIMPATTLDEATVESKPYRPRPVRPVVLEKVGLQVLNDVGNVQFELEIPVLEVCVRENYISLLLQDGIGVRPAGALDCQLNYRDRTYRVRFAGAEFEFASVQVRGISFLRIGS